MQVIQYSLNRRKQCISLVSLVSLVSRYYLQVTLSTSLLLYFTVFDLSLILICRFSYPSSLFLFLLSLASSFLYFPYVTHR